jgi:hypothetical protein
MRFLLGSKFCGLCVPVTAYQLRYPKIVELSQQFGLIVLETSESVLAILIEHPYVSYSEGFQHPPFLLKRYRQH